MINKYFENLIHSVFGHAQKGIVRMVDPDGETRIYGDQLTQSTNTPLPCEPEAMVKIHRRDCFRKWALAGDIGLAESYLEQDYECADIEPWIRWLIVNQPYFMQKNAILRLAIQLKTRMEWFPHAWRHNSKKGSRRNILAHYDLGNAFYSQFLDSTMAYSCGLFESPECTLEDAQQAKYRRLAEQLDLSSHHHTLEIGCGWGGFAIYLAKKYGCRVTGITLSPAQLEYARGWAMREGLQAEVNFELQDYRDLNGVYDRIVSIEMLEAVGHRYLSHFFETCHRLLANDGRLVVQSITCPDARYEQYRKQSDFIRKHVFPGGHLPSCGAILDATSRKTDLELLRLDCFNEDYARTLRLWRARFQANWKSIAPLGFDERFYRLWNFYLAYCEAAFRIRHINLVQFTMEHLHQTANRNVDTHAHALQTNETFN